MRQTFRSFLFVFFTSLLLQQNCSKAQSYYTLISSNYALAAKNVVPGHSVYQSGVATVNIPIQIKNDYKILTALTFHRISLQFDSSKLVKEFYSTGINLGFVKKLQNGSFVGMLLCRTNADQFEITRRSGQVGGLVLVNRKMNDKLTLKYGLYFNSERFGPFFVPLLGLDWKALEKWRVFGVMPQNLCIENKINTFFRWGIAYFSPTFTFHVTSPAPNLYLHQNQSRIGVFGDFYLTKKIVATVKIDYPVSAKYRVFNEAQKYDANIWGIGIGGLRNSNNNEIDNINHSLIYQLGFSYRLELE